MLKIIYSPNWFYPEDIIIDVFSIIILLLIAFFSFRYYKIKKKNKNYLWLAVSFTILAVSFLFKVLTNFTIYKNVISTRTIGFLTITYQNHASSEILSLIGFMGFRVLMILGLLILYEIYQTKRSLSDIFLLTYFVIILTYFSRAQYFVFHLTSLVLLLIITKQYFKNYRKNRHTNSKLLFYSFALITISQLSFMLIEYYLWSYIVGEIIQLLGYILLLITFIRVLKYGKKKQN